MVEIPSTALDYRPTVRFRPRDPDDTEGRALYRALAERTAREQASLASWAGRISLDTEKAGE